MAFSSTHPALARALAARDYSVPTAVQLAVLTASAEKRDMLVSAQTGSGKTVAFGIAIAATLLGDAERFEMADLPLALIVAPTRELALQVQRELIWLYADTGARIVTCVGGMDPRAEARQLAMGAHIVVGTPGRLRDQMERKRLDLSALATIVLDEADEMLDLGFREDLEFLLDATPSERQTLLFSATMPREIETLARQYQREAQRIETIRRDEQHADIEYSAIRVAPRDVENAVVNVLRFHEMRAALVFCATREAVKRMQARLLERGFSAVALSGELTQTERTHALQAVRDGRARVLVATDVAARGLDLPDLALVIHADLPRDPETLLHRSGRTGRAGKKGLCTLIVPYSLNRKANQLIGAARVKVTWGSAPTADEIRARDQERFLADPIFSETPADEDVALALALQAGRTADEIALALVRVHRARLPAPEDLAEDTGPVRREDRPRTGKKQYERRTDFVPRAEGASVMAPRGPRPAHASRGQQGDARDMVWFRLNIGRERNADPRWLLPLICKAGNISKAEIGTIKIHDRDTRFQVLAEHADRFADAVRTNKNKEGHIARVSVHTSADDAAVTQALQSIAAPDTATTQGDAAASPPPAAPSPAAPARDSETKPWVKKPWQGKAPADKAGSYKSGAQKPWADKSKFAKPNYDKPRHDDTGAAVPHGSRSDSGKPAFGKPRYDKPSSEHAPAKAPWQKKPWEDRSKPAEGPRGDAKSGAKPHRKGNGHKAAFHAARAVAPAAGPNQHSKPGSDAPSGPKATSKYAHKKKNRPPAVSAK